MLVTWAMAIAFTGVTVGAIAQFNLLTPAQKRKYKWWLIVSLVLIWVGTAMQMRLS